MIDGQNIIYHYLQKTLLSDSENDDFNHQLIERLVIDLSIWLPIELYKQVPVLLPFVVRDAKCRNKAHDLDTWGQANSKGYLKDDNSLVKSIVKSFYVNSERIREYNKEKLGKGFVACHIWRKLTSSNNLASTVGKTNTFVPNLVWLPLQIAKLTDREQSYAQKLLQTISYRIYFEDCDSVFKQNIWSELLNPEIKIKTSFNVKTLNYFNIPETWLTKKSISLINEMELIKNVLNQAPISKEVKCSKYLPTLRANILPEEVPVFVNWLDNNILELQVKY